MDRLKANISVTIFSYISLFNVLEGISVWIVIFEHQVSKKKETHCTFHPLS